MRLNLDRSAWTRVTFGDVVTNVNDNIKDPVAAGISRVLGLEHLDPREFIITRWASTDEETTFTRRVRPGQTLFGKRRAYQRKTAYAKFDAICSGDILVFGSKNPAVLLPELLPFLASTDAFYARALETSAGSLSPRTKWSDIAKYEFDLPPLAEQRRLADLLWAVERQREAEAARRRAVEAVADAVVGECVAEGLTGGSLSKLSDLTIIGRPITYGIVQAGPNVPDGVPYIRVSDMTGGPLTPVGMLRTSKEIAAKYKRSRVSDGDLVVALRGCPGLTLPVPHSLDGANLTQGTARLSVNEANAPVSYVLDMMNSRWMEQQIARKSKGSTFKELSLAALRDLEVPILSRARMLRAVTELAEVRAAVSACERASVRLDELKTALLDEVFVA